MSYLRKFGRGEERRRRRRREKEKGKQNGGRDTKNKRNIKSEC